MDRHRTLDARSVGSTPTSSASKKGDNYGKYRYISDCFYNCHNHSDYCYNNYGYSIDTVH